MNSNQFLAFFLFNWLVLFALHVSAQESTELTLPLEVFPHELAEKQLEEQILKRASIDYRHTVKRTTEGLPRSTFIWEVATVENQIAIEELRFEFETEQKKNSGRADFTVSLRYQDEALVVVHSKPMMAQYVNGIKVERSEEEKAKWGGFLYGNEVPGVLFIIPRTRQKSGFPLLLCPRFGIQQNGALVIQGRDPKTKLKRVSAKLSGGTHIDFPTSYTAGSATIRYESIRVAEPEIREGVVIKNDPSFSFLYRPTSSTEEMFTPEESGITPVGLVSHVRLKNPVGYTAHIRHALITWINQMNPPSSTKFHFKQMGQARKEDLGPGSCFHIFPAEHVTTQYSTPAS